MRLYQTKLSFEYYAAPSVSILTPAAGPQEQNMPPPPPPPQAALPP